MPVNTALQAGGLGQAEVLSQRETFGYNEVTPSAAHPVRHFLSKFSGLSAWMLEAIMLLSALLHNYANLALMAVLLVFNAVLGEIQDRRSAGAVAALRRRLQVNSRVCRDSAWQTLPARELVPGDLVRVRSGDVVPADVKLSSGTLSVDESALTGESQTVEKGPDQLLSSGSLVRGGEATGVVEATGARTFFGRTTVLVEQAKPKLHIESVVAKVIRWLLVIVGVLLAGVAILSLWRGERLEELLPLLLVLMMSAVPVALPVMFSVSMAIGSRELARSGVLVTRLSSAEDAALMDVLCVDKTGTLTMNQLTVTEIFPWHQASESEVLQAGALASRESNQDPIDLAFLSAAKDRGVFQSLGPVKTISFLPFSPQTRRTEAAVEVGGSRLHLLKGALRSLAEACALKPEELKELEDRADLAAQKGYRTLAVARATDRSAPVLLGLVSLSDPPRPEAKELVLALQARGVAVRMLTGDALAVARQLAAQVGLPVIHRLSKGEHRGNLLAGVDGLAEVFPADKFLVVQQLQAGGHVTGMTGDGVNDAPALRQAEVGIAVSTATDVAKSAASVVLTQPGLTNVVALVDQGRIIYQRILTWILNKISRTILKATFVTVAYLVTGRFVVSALAMLLLTSMTDLAKIALATDRVRPSKSPESWNIGGFIAISVVIGLAMAAESLGLLAWGWQRYGLVSDQHALDTYSFLTLLYFAAFSILSLRERRRFWSTLPSPTLQAALITDTVVGTLLTRVGIPGLTSLPWAQTLVIFGGALVSCLVLNDTLKVWLIHRLVPNKR